MVERKTHAEQGTYLWFPIRIMVLQFLRRHIFNRLAFEYGALHFGNCVEGEKVDSLAHRYGIADDVLKRVALSNEANDYRILG